MVVIVFMIMVVVMVMVMIMAMFMMMMLRYVRKTRSGDLLSILKPCSELSWLASLPGHLVHKLNHLQRQLVQSPLIKKRFDHLGLLVLFADVLLHLLHLKVVLRHPHHHQRTSGQVRPCVDLRRH